MDAQLLREDLVKLKQRLLFGCRLCLDESELKVNLDSDAGSSSQKLYEIANHYMDLGISPTDEESTHACLSCAGKLIAFKQFHDACKATEKTIQAISNTIRIRKLMGDCFATETPFSVTLEVARESPPRTPPRFSPEPSPRPRAPEQREKPRRKSEIFKCGRCPMKFDSKIIYNLHYCITDVGAGVSSIKLRPRPKKPSQKAKTLIVSCHHCSFRSTRNMVAMHESVKHQTRVKGSQQLQTQKSCGQKLFCIENRCSFNTTRTDSLLNHLIGIHKYNRDQARQISRRTLFEAKRKQAQSSGKKQLQNWLKCPICSSLYETLTNLRMHISHVHRKTPKVQQVATNLVGKLWSCPFCATKSKYPRSIQRHLIEVHGYSKAKASKAVTQLEGPTERTEVEINWSEMFVHTQKGRSKGRFRCRFCRILCLTQSGCKNHIKMKHVDKFAPGQLLKCSQPPCPALLSSRDLVDRHEKTCRFRNKLCSK